VGRLSESASILVAMATVVGETPRRSPPKSKEGAITQERCETHQKFVLTTNSKSWVIFQNLPPFWLP